MMLGESCKSDNDPSSFEHTTGVASNVVCIGTRIVGFVSIKTLDTVAHTKVSFLSLFLWPTCSSSTGNVVVITAVVAMWLFW